MTNPAYFPGTGYFLVVILYKALTLRLEFKFFYYPTQYNNEIIQFWLFLNLTVDLALEQKLSDLSLNTDTLLQDLRGLDPEILQKCPNKNSWSVLQVLNHLQRSELGSLMYVKKKYLGIDEVPNVGIKQKLLMWVSKYMYGGAFRYKAITSLSSPSNEGSLELAGKNWKTQRKELEDFISSLPQEHINKAVYKHPILGRISMGQMLQFFADHLYHHEKQIDRILSTWNIQRREH